MHGRGYYTVHHNYIGKHLLFCPVENPIEMDALYMNSLCFLISNFSRYHANNIVCRLLKVSFAIVDMYCVYTCLKALYLI